jgi:hypothetical protein
VPESIKFLAKAEILDLSVLPNIHVRRAIQDNKKLDAILSQALNRSIDDKHLTDMERLNVESLSNSNALVCEHNQLSYQKCDDCRPIRPFIRQKIVWLSGGGGKFHYDRHCELAMSGQNRFAELGGTPLHWYSSSENIVKWSRFPCFGCVVKKPLHFEWIEQD